jgi:hypothetical protein
MKDLKRQSYWALPPLLIVLLAVQMGAEEKQPPTVKLTIDYGDGCQKCFTSLPHKSAMTVLDALRLAEKHPRGIEFRFRGKGSTALLTRIDDLENQGGQRRNWIFRVNNKLGDRSFAAVQLKAGDTVLWKFEKYR